MMKKLLFLFAFLFFLFPFLSAETQPFSWSWQREDRTLCVILRIRENARLYAEQTSVQLKNSSGKFLKAISVPAGLPDPETEEKIYSSPVSTWRFQVQDKDFPLTLSLAWQGCRDTRCFMPENKTFSLAGTASGGVLYGPSETSSAQEFPDFVIERSLSGYASKGKFLDFLRGHEEKNFFSMEGKGTFLVILLTLFGGILLNFTPCVLPMIPVNLMIIGAGKKAEKRSSALLRGTVYACGIALACGVSGMTVVLGSSTLGELDSSWLFNAAAAVVFILLGLSLFDLFSVDLSRFKTKFTMPSAVRLTGVFLLGALSALLAGACVAPVVIAVFLQSAGIYAKGNAAGLFLPFVLGIGMALPWPAAAAGIVALPRPGAWMKHVKYFFGFLIVLLGGWYAFLSGSLLLKKASGTAAVPDHGIVPALAESRRTGKAVLIDFRADWCRSCLAMEQSVFTDPEVRKEMRHFLFVRFDATDASSPEVKKVLRRFQVTGFPTCLIVRTKEKAF